MSSAVDRLRGVASGDARREALPVALSDRRDAAVRATAALDGRSANQIVLTAEGEGHPAMRIGASCRHAAVVGGLAYAGVHFAGRRSQAGRHGPRGDERPDWRRLPGRGRAAVRARPIDDVLRRGDVALEDDAAVRGSQLRTVLAARSAMARRSGAGPGVDLAAGKRRNRGRCVGGGRRSRRLVRAGRRCRGRGNRHHTWR